MKGVCSYSYIDPPFMTLNINFIGDYSVVLVLEKFIDLRQGYFLIFIVCAKLPYFKQLLITWYDVNKQLRVLLSL